MEPNYWLNRWNAQEIGFHQKDFEFYLLKYFSNLKPTTVLVPLCGKTLDMVWLAKQGHKVIGVELSAVACQEFFAENYNSEFTKELQDSFTVFRHKEISIYCGNFFDLKINHLEGVTAIYDRAALIALPKEMRKQYTTHLRSLFQGTSQLLLIALEYDQSKMEGPPFSVSDEEVLELYKNAEQVTHLERDTATLSPRAAPSGMVIDIVENIYFIKL